MKTRVVKNWKTSILGLVLLIVSIAMLYLKILTGGEFIALLPTTIGLLCVPDSILKKW
jgi:Na+-transporting methylmalonyl-CoA/oxaloacetate decarboxylase beta subunit